MDAETLAETPSETLAAMPVEIEVMFTTRLIDLDKDKAELIKTREKEVAQQAEWRSEIARFEALITASNAKAQGYDNEIKENDRQRNDIVARLGVGQPR